MFPEAAKSDSDSVSSVNLETEYLNLQVACGPVERSATRKANRDSSRAPMRQVFDLQQFTRVPSTSGRPHTRRSTGSSWSRESILGPSSHASVLDLELVDGLSKELDSFNAPFDGTEKRRSTTIKVQLEKYNLDELTISRAKEERPKFVSRRSLLSEGIAAARIQEQIIGVSVASNTPDAITEAVLPAIPVPVSSVSLDKELPALPALVEAEPVKGNEESIRPLACPWPLCSKSYSGMNRLKYFSPASPLKLS